MHLAIDYGKSIVANQQVEKIDTGEAPPDMKSVKVRSIELADALAKDKPSKWSPGMLQLYGIMLLVTISKRLTQVTRKLS